MSHEAGSPSQAAEAARAAQRTFAAQGAAVRTAALRALAEVLVERRAEILTANQRDLEAADEQGVAPALVHRLKLDEAKLGTLVEGIRQLVDGPDPVGRPLRRTELDEGLELTQVTSPIGVLLIIFESRPDAVIQIGSLALRTGNAVLLKGGSEARHSNRVLVAALREALDRAGAPPDIVQGVEGRESVREILTLDHLIDLVIPRGSGELVRSIQDTSRIPVLGHAEGVCHLYLDREADPEMAAHLSVDGKCDYPAACNATETLLVHREFLPHLPGVARALLERGVELRADPESLDGLTAAGLEGIRAASERDWGHEYGDLTLAIRTVASLEEAIDHIHRWGSAHTEAIVTGDEPTAHRFLDAVDAASVFWNASTRFADGFRYGLGAEVGISTGRIHARGPVGAEGLLTTRWLLRGSGQGAADYGSGPDARRFRHRPLDP